MRAKERYAVLYDQDCPLCVFQMKTLTWLDWLDLLTLMPLSHPRVAVVAPTLTREQLLEAMHCVTPDGVIYRGARSIRFIGMRLPLLVPVALILWIPGVIWVAERIYQWISRNRLHLAKLFGCGEACAIMPTRAREQDSGLSPLPSPSPSPGPIPVAGGGTKGQPHS